MSRRIALPLLLACLLPSLALAADPSDALEKALASKKTSGKQLQMQDVPTDLPPPANPESPAASSPESPASDDDTIQGAQYNTIILQGLNKVTGHISHLESPLGASMRFGNLEIIARRCWKASPEERPENAALLEIWELRPGEGPQKIFLGWMFSSSPGLSGLEHPVYDITVLACEQRSDPEKKEAEKKDDTKDEKKPADKKDEKKDAPVKKEAPKETKEAPKKEVPATTPAVPAKKAVTP